jgi:pimeloyl-ACP methyl ester carboxylesterase
LRGAARPCTQARELRAGLQAVGVAPPYLLVGHSIGGLYQHAFTRRYPEEVAALLLIGPTHPQHWSTMEREAPALSTFVRTMRATAAWRQCSVSSAFPATTTTCSARSRPPSTAWWRGIARGWWRWRARESARPDLHRAFSQGSAGPQAGRRA